MCLRVLYDLYCLKIINQSFLCFVGMESSKISFNTAGPSFENVCLLFLDYIADSLLFVEDWKFKFWWIVSPEFGKSPITITLMIESFLNLDRVMIFFSKVFQYNSNQIITRTLNFLYPPDSIRSCLAALCDYAASFR